MKPSPGSDEEIRDFVRRSGYVDETDFLTSFVIVTGYVADDNKSGVIITASEGTAGYVVRGLLAEALAIQDQTEV